MSAVNSQLRNAILDFTSGFDIACHYAQGDITRLKEIGGIIKSLYRRFLGQPQYTWPQDNHSTALFMSISHSLQVSQLYYTLHINPALQETLWHVHVYVLLFSHYKRNTLNIEQANIHKTLQHDLQTLTLSCYNNTAIPLAVVHLFSLIDHCRWSYKPPFREQIVPNCETNSRSCNDSLKAREVVVLVTLGLRVKHATFTAVIASSEESCVSSARPQIANNSVQLNLQLCS